MLTDKQQAAAAKAFAEKWKGEHAEEQEGRSFWIDLLQSVFGVEKVLEYICFEKPVRSKSTQRIDAYIPATKVLIEQKSSNVPLDLHIQRGPNKVPITPYGQAKEYDDHLPYQEKAEWIITCNFKEFWIYDMKEPENIRIPVVIALSNLKKDYKQLRILVDNRSDRLVQEKEISVKAGELVKKIYNLLEKQYPELDETARRNLNILCVRIVFCLYAEDAGVFDRNQFHDYLTRYDAADFGERLEKLFEVLNTPEENRSFSLSEQLKAFPYTNGGLFAETIQVPPFTDELRTLILDKASLGFNWSNISPTIFGALFESTINPETRSEGGMHYTSIENIHKVIDPLFLDDLKIELDGCLKKRQHETDTSQRQRLVNFQNKLASLCFLDPACGSGNFLTETYLSLREMENIVIRNIYKRQEGAHNTRLLLENPIKVSINQFYGIEYNDFAVSVSQVALWISEAKMLQKTEDIVGYEIPFLPLKTNANIVEGNALRMEWPTTKYIIGNPPFQGARTMSDEQKSDVRDVFGSDWQNVGNLDYVSCWFRKAEEMLREGRADRAAFVATNSICQGEQVANLWRPLMANGLHIDFAHRTFRWDNEAEQIAHVHCVIVGFSYTNDNPKIIFDDNCKKEASHINAYLLNSDDVFLSSRQHPLCDVPLMLFGSMANDGGNLLLNQEERDSIYTSWPYADKYIRQFVGADEYINNRPRYCLWLKWADSSELRQSSEVMRRINAVHEHRAGSSRQGTRRMAEYPSLFGEDRQPSNQYIIVPNHTSENRRYIPLSFMSPDVIASNAVQIIPTATLYHFGVLESSVHMAWMRAVCGRLKSDYRYSKDIVYNNFPWPTPTDAQRMKIEQTAQAILDARALYPKSSLADLYDELTMPAELRKAHQANDLAVMKAYGFSSKMTEEEIVKKLFERYIELISN